MPRNIEHELEKETVKWLERIEAEVKKMKVTNKNEGKRIESSIENIHAYISDCKHFLEKRDLINAFEAVVYAWGILETLERMGAITRD